MSSKTPDPVAVFSALKPADLDQVTRQAYARRRDTDLALALAEPTPTPTQAPAPNRARTRARTNVRFGLATVSAAAVVAAGVAGVAVTRHAQTPPARAQSGALAGQGAPAVLTAQSLLLSSADRAAAVPASSGAYWHSVERVYQWTPVGSKRNGKKPGAFHAYVATTLQTWQGKDGRFHADNGLDPAVTWPSAADEAGWRAAGSPAMSTVEHSNDSGASTLRFSFGGKSLTLAQVQALPTDPATLRSWLATVYQADHAGLDLNSFIYGSALDGLTAPTTSGTRAALYRVLAQLPGVHAVGAVQDPLGRHGTAVERPETTSTGGQQVRQLIINPGTGALLSDVVYAGTSGIGSPVFWEAWQSQGWTNQLGG